MAGSHELPTSTFRHFLYEVEEWGVRWEKKTLLLEDNSVVGLSQFFKFSMILTSFPPDSLTVNHTTCT